MTIKNKKGLKEVRCSVAPQKFEIRKNADGSRTITGYFAVFNSLSEDLGGFREKIQIGAFAQSLKIDYPDPLCLYGHDNNQILGRVASGTLQVAEDQIGLRFTCQLPDTSTARDLISLLERGDVSSCSFGFQTVEDAWDEDANGNLIRTLLQVVFFEGSIVGQPAYSGTSVNLRSCPVGLRSKLRTKKRDDEDVCNPDSPDYDADACEDEDDEDDEERCDCQCSECLDGDCDECTGDDCDDEDCTGCPNQDDTRSDKLRIRSLFAHRTKFPSLK